MEISNKILIPAVLFLAGLFVYQYFDYPIDVEVTRSIDQTDDHHEQIDTTLVARRDVRSYVDQEIRSVNPAKIRICPLERYGPFGQVTTYGTGSINTCITDYQRAGYRELLEASQAAQQ